MAMTPPQKPGAGGLQAGRPRPTMPQIGGGGMKRGQGPVFGGGGPVGRWRPDMPTMGTGGMKPSVGQHPAMPSMPGMLPQRQPGGGGMMYAGGSPNFNESTGTYGGGMKPGGNPLGGMPQFQGGGMMQQGQVDPRMQQAMMRMLMQRFGGGTNLGMGQPGGGMMRAY